MRLALKSVHRHLARALHVLHAAVQVGDVLLQHGMAFGSVVVVDQHGDLVEAHAGGLAAEDHRDAYEIVVAVEPTVGAVALGLQQSHALPVTEHVGVETESGRGLADGAQLCLPNP